MAAVAPPPVVFWMTSKGVLRQAIPNLFEVKRKDPLRAKYAGVFGPEIPMFFDDEKYVSRTELFQQITMTEKMLVFASTRILRLEKNQMVLDGSMINQALCELVIPDEMLEYVPSRIGDTKPLFGGYPERGRLVVRYNEGFNERALAAWFAVWVGCIDMEQYVAYYQWLNDHAVEPTLVTTIGRIEDAPYDIIAPGGGAPSQFVRNAAFANLRPEAQFYNLLWFVQSLRLYSNSVNEGLANDALPNPRTDTTRSYWVGDQHWNALARLLNLKGLEGVYQAIVPSHVDLLDEDRDSYFVYEALATPQFTPLKDPETYLFSNGQELFTLSVRQKEAIHAEFRQERWFQNMNVY